MPSLEDSGRNLCVHFSFHEFTDHPPLPAGCRCRGCPKSPPILGGWYLIERVDKFTVAAINSKQESPCLFSELFELYSVYSNKSKVCKHWVWGMRKLRPVLRSHPRIFLGGRRRYSKMFTKDGRPPFPEWSPARVCWIQAGVTDAQPRGRLLWKPCTFAFRDSRV